MPSLTEICRTAKIERDTFNNLRRAGHVSSWPDEGSEEFAIRLGLFAAFRSVGYSVSDAVNEVEFVLSRKKIPMWHVANPLDRKQHYTNVAAFELVNLKSLCDLVSDGIGRFVDEGEEFPSESDELPGADTLQIINIHSVVQRMKTLFT